MGYCKLNFNYSEQQRRLVLGKLIEKKKDIRDQLDHFYLMQSGFMNAEDRLFVNNRVDEHEKVEYFIKKVGNGLKLSFVEIYHLNSVLKKKQ